MVGLRPTTLPETSNNALTSRMRLTNMLFYQNSELYR